MAVTANASIPTFRGVPSGHPYADHHRPLPRASKCESSRTTGHQKLSYPSVRSAAISKPSPTWSRSKTRSNFSTELHSEHSLEAGRIPAGRPYHTGRTFRSKTSYKFAIFRATPLIYARPTQHCPLCASSPSNGSAISHVPNTVAPANRRDSDAVPSSTGRATRQDRARPSASAAGNREAGGSAGEDPYRIVGGRKIFVDELDVVGFLDGYEQLRSIDPQSYNPAAYLW